MKPKLSREMYQSFLQKTDNELWRSLPKMCKEYRLVYPTVTEYDYYISTITKFKAMVELDTVEKSMLFIETLKQNLDARYTRSNRSRSEYIVTNGRVYRYSNHWGKSSSCIWDIDYKMPGFQMAYCDIKDFKPRIDSNCIVSICPDYHVKATIAIRKVLVEYDKLCANYTLPRSFIHRMNKYKQNYLIKIADLKSRL